MLLEEEFTNMRILNRNSLYQFPRETMTMDNSFFQHLHGNLDIVAQIQQRHISMMTTGYCVYVCVNFKVDLIDRLLYLLYSH